MSAGFGMRRSAVLFGLVLVLGACAQTPGAPSTPSSSLSAASTSSDPNLYASGVVNLPFGANGSVEMAREGSECVAIGSYWAVESRAKVHVLDGKGVVAGVGGLGPGKLVEDEATGESAGCSWEFKVPVERGGRVYYVQVIDWRTENITETRLEDESIILVPSASTRSDTEIPEQASGATSDAEEPSSSNPAPAPSSSTPPSLSPEQQLEEAYKVRYEEAGVEAIGGVGSASALAKRQCETLVIVDGEDAGRVPFAMAAAPNLDPIGVEVFCSQFVQHLEAALRGFSDGARTVGLDIEAGTYRTAARVSDCYWERTTENGSIIANDFVSYAPEGVIVTVNDGEGFVTSRCGGWLPAS